MNDDLNPDVRRLVDLTRHARTPGAAEKRRVAERLAGPLAAGAAVTAAATAAKAGGAKALLAGGGAKLAAAVFVSAALTAALVTQLPSPSVTPTPAPSPPPRSNSADVQPRGAAPAMAEVAAPTPPSASAAPALSRSQQAPTRPLSTGRELEEDAALLHRAQAAWRAGQSARALELASEHARRFPRSQLASERDVLRVLSLCKLGQVQTAKQVGARLLRSAKGSPWYQSVAESCAADAP